MQAVSLHPYEFVTYTQYILSPMGETTITESFRPLLHAYIPPPVAESVVLCPAVITISPVIPAGGLEITITVAIAVSEHDPLVTITE